MSLIVAMALSGLEPDLWNGQLKDIYDRGALLVELIKKTNSSSATSKADIGFASLHAHIVNCITCSKKYSASSKMYKDKFLQMCNNKKQVEAYVAKKNMIHADEQMRQHHVFDDKKVIMYQKRNVLDLGSNLKAPFDLSYAQLPTKMKGYFENRSQISRVNGAYPPISRKVICNEEDCRFVEDHF